MTNLVLLVPLLLLIVASVIDLKTREIPDWISIGLVVVGMVAAMFGWAGIQWWMVVSGAVLGLVIGLALYGFAGFGGGDGKLIAGIGAFLGPVGLLFVLFWMALAGGVLALVAKFRGQRDFAYGPAILLGYVGYLFYPADVWSNFSALLN